MKFQKTEDFLKKIKIKINKTNKNTILGEKTIIFYWKQLKTVQQFVKYQYRHYLDPPGGECQTAELVRLK